MGPLLPEQSLICQYWIAPSSGNRFHFPEPSSTDIILAFYNILILIKNSNHRKINTAQSLLSCKSLYFIIKKQLASMTDWCNNLLKDSLVTSQKLMSLHMRLHSFRMCYISHARAKYEVFLILQSLCTNITPSYCHTNNPFKVFLLWRGSLEDKVEDFSQKVEQTQREKNRSKKIRQLKEHLRGLRSE